MTTSTDPTDIPRRSNPIRALSLRIEPLARPLAGSRFFPLWAVLEHTGRRSGQTYRTPVVTFRIEGGFVIPLPFGDATQWAKNLVAADRGALRWRGRDWSVQSLEIVPLDRVRPALGPVFGRVSAAVGIRDFVRVRDA